jgi:hypothetical protein
VIDFLHTPNHPVHGAVNVYLEVTPDAMNAPSAALREFYDAAVASHRTMGLVLREYGGETFFAYDALETAGIEKSLLTLLMTPMTHVTVTQAESRAWKNL